jgi:hypothetical protein
MKLIDMAPQNWVLLSTITVGPRMKRINVSTYFYTSEVRTDYPSGVVEFTPISCVELRVPSVNSVAIMSEWFRILTIEDSDTCKQSKRLLRFFEHLFFPHKTKYKK